MHERDAADRMSEDGEDMAIGAEDGEHADGWCEGATDDVVTSEMLASAGRPAARASDSLTMPFPPDVSTAIEVAENSGMPWPDSDPDAKMDIDMAESGPDLSYAHAAPHADANSEGDGGSAGDVQADALVSAPAQEDMSIDHGFDGDGAAGDAHGGGGDQDYAGAEDGAAIAGSAKQNTSELTAAQAIRDRWRGKTCNSVPVGARVKILRPGELMGMIGTVMTARSGYYLVKFESQEAKPTEDTCPEGTVNVDGEGGDAEGGDFEGGDLGRGSAPVPVVDLGSSISCSAAAAARSGSTGGGKKSRKKHQKETGGVQSMYFRGKEIWDTAKGEDPPEVPPEVQETSRPVVAPGGDHAASSGEGNDGGDKPPWWWQQSWRPASSRKRKPTLLYDADNGGQTTASAVPSHLDNFLRKREPRTTEADHGLVNGSEVLIVKAGAWENVYGTVQSMHNGYFQVITETGSSINARAKDLQLLASDGKPAAIQMAPRCVDTVHALLGSQMEDDGYGAPRSFLLPGAPATARGRLPQPRPPATQKSPARVRRDSRRTHEIMTGHSVTVTRPGPYCGLAGKVVGSSHGYLIVQLVNGRSAYFRARDVDLDPTQKGETLPSVLLEAPLLSKKTLSKKEHRDHPANLAKKASSSFLTKERMRTGPAITYRRGGGPKAATTADPAAGERLRISWRDNVQDEAVDEQPPHEHVYERAVKVPPAGVAALIDRVESMLARLPPEPPPQCVQPASYAGASLRMLPSIDAAAQLADFQQRWRRGEPVVVPGLQSQLKRRWGPHGFLQRFGAEQVQMIDCRDGKSVHWLSLAHFFAGYLQPWTRALCPDTFRPMMLKLKDW